ncbi:MAG: WGR domain-containing protein [Alphaproteobacteria bacterium]|nr:WGR domain-containing protein [Alphaproteobacteria bacterium]
MDFARDFLRIVYDILSKKDLAAFGQGVFAEHFLISKEEGKRSKMVSNFCCLRAKNPSKTLDRRYTLYLTRDLFGGWLLITQGEREGRKGNGKRYTFTDKETAQKKFQQTLKRWINTQKRNGYDYHVIEEG